MIMLTLPGAAAAKKLPDAPSPKRVAPQAKPAIVGPFWDRQAKIQGAAWLAIGSADVAQTCVNFSNGGHELWMPVQNCRSLALSAVGIFAATELLSYELHRHGHHQLERWPVRIGIAGNLAGLISTEARR